MNNKQGISSLQRLINAGQNSYHGLKACYRSEQAFRQEFWLTVILTPLAIFFSQNNLEIALLLGSLFLVLIVELLNSSIETLADRVSLELNDLIKKAKDIGSAAVLLSLLNLIVIWSCVILLR